MASAAGSWLAALTALAILSVLGITGDSLPLHEWPLVLGMTGALHFGSSAVVYEPLVRLLETGGNRKSAPIILPIAALVPLVFFVFSFGGTPRDIGSPEGILFASFFIVSGGVFGLLRNRFSKTPAQ